MSVRYHRFMIATFTDFGVNGPYLGQVRAVLCQQAPDVPVVDIFPDLPAFDPRPPAYLLPAYSRYLPARTVCLCVVDPGVGGARAAVAVEADGRWYVGPDNGLLSQVIRRASSVSAYAIDWRPPGLSNTFHARDLFAPVCAMLANGEPPPGKPVEPDSLAGFDWPDDLLEVVYFDVYGNAVTGLRAGQLRSTSQLTVGGVVCRFCPTFEAASPDTPFWYVNANGLVEIAVAGQSARSRLSMCLGQPFGIMHS